MLIMSSLFLMGLISLFSILSGGGDLVGVSQSVGYEELFIELNMTDMLGVLGIVISATVVGGILGFQFIGSGLNSASVQIIILGTLFITMWVFLSLLAQPLIWNIPIFGPIVYVFLTIAYAIGCITQMTGGGVD